MTFRGKR